MAGCCEHGNELYCSIKGRECFDLVGDSQLLNKYPPMESVDWFEKCNEDNCLLSYCAV
jgi:hypothetical protein